MLYSRTILFLVFFFAICHLSLSEKDYPEPELIEGDIVLDESTAFAVVDTKSPGKRRRKREIPRNTIKVWNNAVIPYVISDEMGMKGRKVIRKAFRNLARRTCVTFIPKQAYHNDFVKFIAARKGCYSSIGRKGGEQVVSLGDGCLDRGHVIHEIMHALGFFHEHSRFDRDKYVKILWWNIQRGMERNFLSYSHHPVDSLNEPYDLFSIMHYDNKAFSRNGQDTMQSRKNPYLRFGRHRSLSRVDIKQLTKLYNCPIPSTRNRGFCYNKYSRCSSYAATSDVCEKSYEFMRIYCSKACGFC